MKSSLCLLLALAGLTACSTAGSGSAATPLENTDWRLVELDGRPALGTASERAAQLRFVADSGRVVGSTGCNRLSGSYERTGASLRFGPAITTKMACLDPQMNQQEVAFIAAIDATERHEVAGDTLTLLGRAGPVARFTKTAQ
jgi:heat shock protein HslJ